MTNTITLHECVDKVIAQIKRGWIQEFYAKDGCMCLSGAITENTPMDYFDADIMHSARGRVRNIIESEIYAISTHVSIPTWNDDPNRTKEDVLNLLNQIKEKWPDETFTQGLTTYV